MQTTSVFSLFLLKAFILILSILLLINVTEAGEVFYITDWEGTLSTPDYPNTYPSSSNLTWIKSVSPGNRVKITIQDFKTQCNGDYLEIRDGDSIVSPLIEQVCGKLNSSQSKITSSGTNILLRFVSDNVNDGVMDRGFLLKHSGLCKVHINQTGGVIATPNYPNNYPNYMDCLWTIQLHPAMLIPLVCDNIAIEKEEGCPYDYMEILESDGPSFTVIERHCGLLNRSVTVERNGSLSIRFVSDKDKENKGFRCSYNVVRVRGYWTQWTEWTGCSRHENQTRSRTCINPSPESGLELLCGDIAGTERRNCSVTSPSNTILPSSSGINNTSCLPSISLMSSNFSGTLRSSQDNALLTPSHSSAALFLRRSDVTFSASNSRVTPSLRQSGVTPISDYPMGAVSQLFSTLLQNSSGDNVTGVSFSSKNLDIAHQENNLLYMRPLSQNSASFTPSSGQLDAVLSTSHSQVGLSSSHLNLATSHSVIIPSIRYDGSTSKSNFLDAESTSQRHVTVSSVTSLVSVLPSHPVVKLSLKKSQLIQFVPLTTLQGAHHSTRYPSSETISISRTSFLGDKLVTHPNHQGSRVDLSSRMTDTSTQNGLSTLPYLYTPSVFAFNKSIVKNIDSAGKTIDTSEKARNDHLKTSNVTHPTSVSSGVSFQFSILSGTFIPSTEKNSQDGFVSLANDNTKPSLSVDGDTLLSADPDPTIVRTSHASPVDVLNNGNSSHKYSLESSLMDYSVHVENSSARQRSMQMVQLSKPENIAHIQTHLTSIISAANKSSLSTSKLFLLTKNHDTTLTTQSNHSSFASSSIIQYFNSVASVSTRSSSDFLRDIYTYKHASSSVQSVDRTIFPAEGFIDRATIAKLSSFSKGSGPSTIGGHSHSLVLETSPASFTLETDVFLDSAKRHTPSLTLGNSSLNAVSVLSSQKSIMTLSSPSTSGKDSKIILLTESAGLVSPISQGIRATAIFSLPFWKDSKAPFTRETYGQTSGGMSSLSAPTYHGLHPPLTTATAHISSWRFRTRLIKTTSSRDLSNEKPHIGVDSSLTPSGRFVTEMHLHTSFQGPQSSSPVSTTSSTIVAPGPTSKPDRPPVLKFPWHLTPFLVIIFIILVVLATYYLRLADVVLAIILAVKEKRRKMKESSPSNFDLNTSSLDLRRGNFSTEGLQTSHFHSYQREVFYEKALNYAFFEKAEMKTIAEFSVRVEDENQQSSESEESVEISCEMGEETVNKKQESDSLSEMFPASDSDFATKKNVQKRFPPVDPKEKHKLHLQHTPPSYEM